MGATTTRKCLQIFCKAIMELYGEEFLRKPTYTDMKKLYAHNKEKHGFPGMLGSIDCTARKDVERAFGVLKKKWKLIKHLARGMSRRRLSDVMYTCIILHNMIIHDNEVAISSKNFREEQHRDDDPQSTDCTGRVGISSLIKCTSVIRQMAYDAVPDALDEYMQLGAKTTRKCLQMFCKAIMELNGEEFLRKPTYTDMEKLYAYHEEKHGFPRMLGSIDCTGWSWENCPAAFQAQFCRGDHGPDPFIIGSDSLQ
ncbi:ALP1-like protein [Tanacetum coccineum]